MANNKGLLIAGVLIFGVICLIVVSVLVWYFLIRKPADDDAPPPPPPTYEAHPTYACWWTDQGTKWDYFDTAGAVSSDPITGIDLEQCKQHCNDFARCTAIEHKPDHYCAFWYDNKCTTTDDNWHDNSSANTYFKQTA